MVCQQNLEKDLISAQCSSDGILKNIYKLNQYKKPQQYSLTHPTLPYQVMWLILN